MKNFLFNIYEEDLHIVLKVLGIKLRLKNNRITPLKELCCIPNLENFKQKQTKFPHPIGIVINKNVKIGNNCTIYQNVTIGSGKRPPPTGTDCPEIGNNVTIYANTVIAGGIKIGDNSIIGAGSIVIKDVPANTTVAGNPAKILK